MVREKFAVGLTPEERDQLEHLVRAGKSPARVTTRARILLKTGEGWPFDRLRSVPGVPGPGRFRGHGVPHQAALCRGRAGGALKDRVQVHRYRKLDERAEAHLIALACSPAPDGHDHWELRLLTDRIVELGVVESLSHETVRLHLKKTP